MSGAGDGLALLRARAEALPGIVTEAFAGPEPEPLLRADAVRGIVTTGVGSSAAHARFLSHLLAAELGLPARFAAPGGFVSPPGPRARDELLVVFSQGLSPNARFALAHPDAWRRLVLVTATPRDGGARPDAAEKRALLERLAAAGACIVPMPGADEYGTLLRLSGPLAGFLTAIRLARALAPSAAALPALFGVPPARLRAAVAGAPDRLAALFAREPAPTRDERLVFVALGDTAELSENLRYKILEGWRLPAPPVYDLLHLAHGPWQELHERSACLVALTHSGVAPEAAALRRLEALLVPGRHRLLRLEASLPSPLSVVEHEALVDALVLRGLEGGGPDPARFEGSCGESALYRMAPETESDDGERRLAHLRWPEVAALLARGCTTAIVPLGALEQHGPHLPLDTDVRIADALAGRLCAAMPEAVRLPALFAGCSREHMAFPGTLDLRPATLEATLLDLLDSLVRHGFQHLVVFSAHGGNDAPLRAAEARLRAAAAPARLSLLVGLERIAALQLSQSVAAGAEADACGAHAGEHETSILLGLAPEEVRADRLEAGVTGLPGSAQEAFYPSLRRVAPNGVLGDPRAASAARAEAYLSAWAGLLLSMLRAEKNDR